MKLFALALLSKSTWTAIIGLIGLILYSFFGEVPNYEAGIQAILTLLALLGIRLGADTPVTTPEQ